MLKWHNLDETNIKDGLYVIRLADYFGDEMEAIARFDNKTGWWFDPTISTDYDIQCYASLDDAMDLIPS